MNKNFIIITIGVISILISVSTWAMDLLGWVEECIYCRTERTVIGLLGIIILLPNISYIKTYLGYVFGFFGANVASDQIFLNIRNTHFGLMFLLASCALFILIAQVGLIHYFDLRKVKDKVATNKEKISLADTPKPSNLNGSK